MREFRFVLGAVAVAAVGCSAEPGPTWGVVDDAMAITREGLSISLGDEGKAGIAPIVMGGNVGVGGIVNFAERFDPATRTWKPLPDIRGIMTSCGEVQRQDHQANVMPDGRILVTGGRYSMTTKNASGCACAHNERNCRPAYSKTLVVYDPDRERVDACNNPAQSEHQIAEDGTCVVKQFDPWTEGWSPLRPLRKPHARHSVTLLSDNGQIVRLLLLGGPGKTLEETAERVKYKRASYKDGLAEDCGGVEEDEVKGTPPSTEGEPTEFITGHSAMLVVDPKNPHNTNLLVVGGAVVKMVPVADDLEGDSAEIEEVIEKNHLWFLPVLPEHPSNASKMLDWSPSNVLTIGPSPRIGHLAVKLPNGNVLIAGGWGNDKQPLADAWIFDIGKKAFRQIPSMHSARAHAGVELWQGQVLVSGGFVEKRALDTGVEYAVAGNVVERFDPETETWYKMPSMIEPRARHGMFRLPEPTDVNLFLVTGGIVSTPLEPAELLDAGDADAGDAGATAPSEDVTSVRAGEILFMNEGCRRRSHCSPGLICEEKRCVTP